MPPAPLDAALAMQLRPGLGLGADGAWLVRFLMSFFGWLAVLVSAGRATRRATPVAAAAAAGAKKPVVDEKPAGEREQSSTDASQALVAVK
ncbi:unnamed protein product [Mycena citricolor]|uniref:Uncharacterized protein n=2 Tax=Mycena citricolor TaxID=2018698 RepID=A0AAD2HZH0_9AGAR|nr:unnamed protein product [Mycena citricolor]